MIMTTDERLASIEATLKKLANPIEENEKSHEKEVDDKLAAIIAKLNEPIHLPVAKSLDDIEPTTDEDKEFIKKRDNKLFWATTILVILSVVSFYQITGLFAIVIGLLFGIVMVHGSVLLDDIIFQGNTLKRIAKSGIGAAIYIAAIIYAIGAGIDVGTSLLTDPLSNDESRKASIGRTTDPIEKGTVEVAKPDTVKQDSVATEN